MKDENIDNILRNQFDLGFLLNYLDKRGKNPYLPFWVSIVDVLRFLPKFEEEIKIIREKYQIEPKKINRELEGILGNDIYKKHLIRSREFARCLYFPDLLIAMEMETLDKKIDLWEQKRFPEVSNEIGKLRISKFGRLHKVWHESIKDYVLYERITLAPIQYRHSFPEVETRTDKDTSEMYINIRIYSDTDIKCFRNPNLWKKMQKILPSYSNPNIKNEETFLSRFLYFVLKRKLGLKHSIVSSWLKSKHLPFFEQNKSSREIRRFLDLFFTYPN